jgi:glycolate oxidase
MDEVLVDVIRGKGVDGVARGTRALILAELDGCDESLVESDSMRLAELCEKAGAENILMASHGGQREKLWAARRILSDAVREKAAHKVSEDIVVPRSEAANLLAALKEMSRKWNIIVASYGHAGDGNYHVNILWDDSSFDSEQVINELFDRVIAMGGTITGEHGIGLSKKKYLPKEQSKSLIELQKSVKRVFDPKGFLNPGKIFI